MKKCKHCEFMENLFNGISFDLTNSEYYLLTEMFVYLHDGKDYCNVKRIS